MSGAASIAATRFLVAVSRLSRIRRFASSVQRWLIGSPTRLMTPSTPSNASSGGRSRAGFQACQVTPGFDWRDFSGLRESPTTWSPRAVQRVADRPPDGAAGSGDEDLHGFAPYPIVANVPVSSVTLAIPAFLASATTAAATAGATSRSKTLGMM